MKGQVKAMGMTEIARRCVNVFEVGMTPAEFCSRYSQGLQDVGVVEGDEREIIEQARKVHGLGERHLVLGVHKVSFQSMATQI